MDSSPRRDFLLGLIFFGAIAVLIYFTIQLTGFSFQPRPQLEMHFPNASGLKQGDAVMVSGKVIGSVLSVEYDGGKPDDRRIRVRAELDQPVTLYQDYHIQITEFTLLGGRVIEIEPGSSAAPVLPEGRELLGIVGPSALEALSDLVSENRDDVRQIIGNVRTLSDDLVQGKGVLGALLNDESMRTDLEDLLNTANQIADDIREGRGTVGMLISDEAVRDRIVSLINDGAAAAVDLRRIAEDLAAGRGTFGALLTDEVMRADAQQLTNNLARSSEGLRELIENATAGRGVFGRLLTDEKLADDLSQSLASLSEVTRRLEDGEGSVGQLLANDEAYQELMDSLGLLTATLEDVREAQPISAFAQLLFNAF